MARTTREESQRTAQRIRETARERFTERGYARVGLDEIGAAAGVTRGAVYHHFGSKRGLFEAVLADAQSTIAQSVDAAAATAGGDLWAQLEAGCHAFLVASTQTHARRIVLIDAPSVLDWHAWRESDARASGVGLRDVLGHLQASGRLEQVSASAAAASLSGAMNEAALWIAEATDPEQAIAQAWAVLQRMLVSLRHH